MAKEASLSNLITEIDYNKVANLANNKTSNRIKIWWTISEIQRSKKDFQLIKVHHVPRHCNVFAHPLKSLIFVIWLNELLM